FKAYIVGGAVRDMVSDKPCKDVDLLTNAAITDIKEIFKTETVKQVGKTFPICIVNGIEIASARANAPIDLFPEADLAKRDFTINSMAYDPFLMELVDPFSGKQDLKDRIIRFTTNSENRIKEDPLRMIRACRFVAKINGHLSASSLKAIKKNKDIVKESVAHERIRHEILKAMVYDQPSLFFRALHEAGLLKIILPSLARCYELDGGPFHGETVFEHMMITGDALSPKNPLLRLTGFLHDVGKFDAMENKNGSITFIGHERNFQMLAQDLEQLRFSNLEIKYITSMVRVHMRSLTPKTSPKAVRRVLATLEDHGIRYRDFLRLRIADKQGNLKKQAYTLTDIRLRLEKLTKEIDRKQGFSIDDLEITGHDIMDILAIGPGSDVGLVKSFLFEKVMDDPALNTKAALKTMLDSIKHKKIIDKTLL
ncbi:MAG: CCA tRNA nucleotidyltransferase, partial [Desulfobacteraceae bacterium]|nr:CCA tRNA nucleotidyltransferase [Desulfobacteraceae bacterium]